MSREHHDWISETMAEIDEVLNKPPITIEESLKQAVERGTMSIKESQECLEAYLKTLGGSPYDRGEVPPDLV